MTSSVRDRHRHIQAALGIFCAVLLFDLYWVARHITDAFREDEWRYFYYADNLLHGYFSPRPRVFLWNGPGYPAVLTPFVKLGWVEGARGSTYRLTSTCHSRKRRSFVGSYARFGFNTVCGPLEAGRG
jgi:hypothetical protein